MNNKENLISIIENKNVNWKDAINLGVDLLVENDIATKELANSIIENTEKLGPYYVLMPNVALAHTSPGFYNKKIGLSLVVFKNKVSFSKEQRHDVNLLFTLSALDGDSHMSILQSFANLFSNDEKLVEKAINAKDKKEIYELFKGVL